MKTFVVFVIMVALGAFYWWWPWGTPPLDYLFPSKEETAFLGEFKIQLEQRQPEMKIADMINFNWDRVCWWDSGSTISGADPLWVLGVNAFTLSRTVYAKEGIITLVFQRDDASLSPMYINKQAYQITGEIVVKDPQSGLQRPCYERKENPILLVQQRTSSGDDY